MYKHILIPTDGSELSKKAVDHGIGLAKALRVCPKTSGGITKFSEHEAD